MIRDTEEKGKRDNSYTISSDRRRRFHLPLMLYFLFVEAAPAGPTCVFFFATKHITSEKVSEIRWNKTCTAC